MKNQTDLERLAELIESERCGFSLTYQLTGWKTRKVRGYFEGLERAAEIVREFAEELKEFNSGDLPHAGKRS